MNIFSYDTRYEGNPEPPLLLFGLRFGSGIFCGHLWAQGHEAKVRQSQIAHSEHSDCPSLTAFYLWLPRGSPPIVIYADMGGGLALRKWRSVASMSAQQH
jgi:hypothetical protein